MKDFLALRIRKSVPKELVIANSKFLAILDLVKFSFLNLVKFGVVDRFLIPSPIL